MPRQLAIRQPRQRHKGNDKKNENNRFTLQRPSRTARGAHLGEYQLYCYRKRNTRYALAGIRHSAPLIESIPIIESILPGSPARFGAFQTGRRRVNDLDSRPWFVPTLKRPYEPGSGGNSLRMWKEGIYWSVLCPETTQLTVWSEYGG